MSHASWYDITLMPTLHNYLKLTISGVLLYILVSGCNPLAFFYIGLKVQPPSPITCKKTSDIADFKVRHILGYEIISYIRWVQPYPDHGSNAQRSHRKLLHADTLSNNGNNNYTEFAGVCIKHLHKWKKWKTHYL